MKRYLFSIFCLCLFIAHAKALDFYVSTTATGNGNGSIENPWQLQQALNSPAAITSPTDTIRIWIRGGVYLNMFNSQTSFNCFTNGTATSPIIFRNYQKERVTIDGQLQYSLYLGYDNCSYTWFWGLEVTNSMSTDRNHDIPGSITCSAENIKFINMVVHDTGSGLDTWKTAKNTEVYGCILYHIGNNLDNNGNLEGHGHGMYVQNDTVGIRMLHNNIIFSTYGYGMKVWQTTTTSAIGNLDIRNNIVFNGGAASDNLGGVGNNSRTHNFFVVSNSVNNPVTNTVIKNNYTFSGTNTPRPPVNAFGLNYGVTGMTLDSNFLTGQTRLGFNNTPVFDASVKDNHIIAGIPVVYGYYLWGFNPVDFPQNSYLPTQPTSGLDYFVLPNKYETGLSHVVIYNWSGASTVQLNLSNVGLSPGDSFELVQAMDFYNDIIVDTFPAIGIINVPMTGHTFEHAVGASKQPVSQFPEFGVFILRKKQTSATTGISMIYAGDNPCIAPNPSNGKFTFNSNGQSDLIQVFTLRGEMIYSLGGSSMPTSLDIDLTPFGKGVYFLKKIENNALQTYKVVIE